LEHDTLAVLTLGVTDTSAGSERIPNEQRLYRDLLANYESAVRPVQNASSVVNIGFRITLNQIVELVSLRYTTSSSSSPGSTDSVTQVSDTGAFHGYGPNVKSFRVFTGFNVRHSSGSDYVEFA